MAGGYPSPQTSALVYSGLPPSQWNIGNRKEIWIRLGAVQVVLNVHAKISVLGRELQQAVEEECWKIDERTGGSWTALFNDTVWNVCRAYCCV